MWSRERSLLTGGKGTVPCAGAMACRWFWFRDLGPVSPAHGETGGETVPARELVTCVQSWL